MAATMTETKGHTIIRDGITILEVDKSLETMIETIVFRVKIATEGQARLSKAGDFGTREVTIHPE